MAESSSHSLVQKILETINVITTIGDFKTHKKECNTLTRRVNLLVPLFEEIRDDQNLRLYMSKGGLRCINALEAALHTAKVLLHLCNKGSKLYLVRFRVLLYNIVKNRNLCCSCLIVSFPSFVVFSMKPIESKFKLFSYAVCCKICL